ncbi:MAG TPA: hypothetical protein VF828_02930 [Patescibacteria group bacterium]
MKNKLTTIFIFAQILFFLIIFFVIPALFITKPYGVSRTQGNIQLPLIDNKSYVFTFTSDHPNLESLEILIKNPLVKNHETINVAVYSGDLKNPLRTFSFSAANSGDPSWVPIKFSPIQLPAGSVYQVAISSPNAYPESLFLIADSGGIPLFKSKYHYSSFKDSFKDNLLFQQKAFASRFSAYSILYFVILLTADCSLFIL